MVNLEKDRSVSIVPGVFLKWLILVSVLLWLLNLAGLLMQEVFGVMRFLSNALVFFFDASQESNIPTLFSTLILFIASLLLYVCHKVSAAGIMRRYWLVLSIVFLFLTVDEAASIHEQFNKFRPEGVGGGGYLTYFWVVPYALFVLAAGIYFTRFLFLLPRRTRVLFIISGGIYVSAAIGFELAESQVTSKYGVGHFYDRLFCAFEEFLEMMGISLFNFAILDHLKTVRPKLLISAPE